MTEKAYLLPVWTDTRLRHFHRTERGRVVAFALQLEIDVQGSWRPAVRYDTAHGFAHIDRFTLAGKRTKERLSLDYGEALTRAERDLKQNWFAYRERFLVSVQPSACWRPCLGTAPPGPARRREHRAQPICRGPACGGRHQ